MKRFYKMFNETNDLYFSYNNEDLINCDKKIKDLNNKILYFKNISKEKVYGGTNINIELSDIANQKIVELKSNNEAPDWRLIRDGLNIFGICLNPKCKAKKKEVIYIPEDMHINYNKYYKFYLNEKITEIKCPICKKIFKPETFGFKNCEYQIVGKKIDHELGTPDNYDSNPKETKNNNLEYYCPYKKKN